MRMVAMMAAAAALVAGAPAWAKPPAGTWANPSGSVHVTFAPCGRAMCGKVVWASAKARADARASTGSELVGSVLFRDFVEQEQGLWAGQVLVPDIGQTFSGTIEQIDARTLRGEGCLFAGFGCKAQTWKRIR